MSMSMSCLSLLPSGWTDKDVCRAPMAMRAAMMATLVDTYAQQQLQVRQYTIFRGEVITMSTMSN